MARIIEACVAEGLQLGETFGPVYKHLLFNLVEDEYRIDGGFCPVTENTCKARTATLTHPYLGCDDETATKIGDIIAKVVNNYKELL